MAGVKLDVGGSRNPKSGYKVLDVLWAEHVDYVCPAWSTPLKDGEVTDLHARHFLEHLSPAEARKTLKEWMRIMAPDTVAEVTVPDLLYHARQLTMPGKSEFLPHETNFNHALSSIYGWQEHGDFMSHKWGYTPQTLRELFRKAGFEVTVVEIRACDICIRARKP